MDTVTVFNTELSGLYDTKPPISKAKMASITRGAMKAIKFYKHVVQSVEKFILKCKPEYKVPGLYVIDSIVRQSRHQFGAEKDVFAPRFARNMQTTFANLFRCTPEDKSKIIRVLNLWQKNCVFAPEVIQPLFDLADPNHPIYQTPNICQNSDVSSNNLTMNSMSHSSAQESPPTNIADEGHTMSSDMSGPITIPTPSQLDSSTIRQLQQLQQFLLRQTGTSDIGGVMGAGGGGGGAAGTSTAGGLTSDSVKFNKKLLDYDYGDEEEEDKPQTPRQPPPPPSSSSSAAANVENNNISQLLNDPNVLRQLQTLQKLKQQEEKQSKLTEMRLQEEAFEKHLATVLKKLPFANECDLSRSNNEQNQIFGMQTNINNLLQQSGLNVNQEHHAEPEVELVSDDGKVEVINLDGNSRSPSMERDRYSSKRRRSRSRSRDRSGNRRRRSRSRTRSPRSRRRSSRDRDRDRTKDKEREREKEREYERERRKKGLPDIKKEHLSVCSTTLWVGHLSKLVQQEELSDTFMKYGDIVSIDMIHPRGCAFIVMNRRQDAYKAMGGLKNYKLQGRVITISWAAGKGVKSKEWKDYWDLDLGVSYIPWHKLEPTTDFESLEEGGMFDEDSMPGWLKEKLKASNQRKDQTMAQTMFPMGDIGSALDTTQPPPQAPPQMLQNVSMVTPFPMGPVPRLMPPLGHMHMPPNMVPGLSLGVPPPQMIMSTGGMVPSLTHLPLDKSVPPPTGAPGQTFMGHFPPPIPGPIPPQLPQHMPQMPPAPTGITSNNNSDDHMDIDMDDEPSTRITNNQPINALNVGPFNRPPPQMFGQNTATPPPTTQNNYSANKDAHDSRDRRRDRSNSRDRRSRDRDRDFRPNDRNRDKDRDVRSRDRDRSDRDRRNDYSRDRDRNSRWGSGGGGAAGDRGRSRENDLPHRERRNNSRERDRNARDRNVDRDKSLQDRLRDIAGENNRSDFNRRGGGGSGSVGEANDWRDGAVPPSLGGNNVSGPFMDQGIRNIRPLNMGPMGGPPPLNDLMHNARGPPPSHRDFDYPRDEFDRRGPPRDFFAPPNRFGPPGQVPPRGIPMGMMRVGPPQFGPRLGGPPSMFMRGQRAGPGGHSGPPPGAGFNDRQFFDRDASGVGAGGGSVSVGGNIGIAGGIRGGRGMNDNRRGGSGLGRSNWNEREDDSKPPPPITTTTATTTTTNRFAQKGDNQSPLLHEETKRSSRWGNTSPKSDVSDEENWDDDEPVKEDDANVNIVNNSKNEIVVPLLAQTEPIDDDSQEDDFNDFDESAPDVNDVESQPAIDLQARHEDNMSQHDAEPPSPPPILADRCDQGDDDVRQEHAAAAEEEETINSESFDMFADDGGSPIPPMPPKINSDDLVNCSGAVVDDDISLPHCFTSATTTTPIAATTTTTNTSNDIQNTTPLYDELQDDSSNKIETSALTQPPQKQQRQHEPEPDIPGVDPDDDQ